MGQSMGGETACLPIRAEKDKNSITDLVYGLRRKTAGDISPASLYTPGCWLIPNAPMLITPNPASWGIGL